ncbi:hypothetical protein DRJ48_05215, partial [Candidatus Woesearchaeota archaeon]
MAEIYFVVKKETLNFEGLFSVHELYTTIDQWFKDKGYDKNEVKNEEIVTKEGKYVELLLEPWKKMTDYLKNVIRLHIRIYNCKEVTVEIDKHKVKMNKGRLQIETEGFLLADYEDRWDQHP